MQAPLSNLKPALLWKHFDEFLKIPRCSRNEQAAAEYVLAFARSKGLAARQDKTGNVVVEVPATPGMENAPTAVLQGHLDMVCEKNSDKVFDFSKDTIEVRNDGGWVTACGTSLGADNG
ncbi:cytosol nonspecific dipeptidase, partial [bacterium]|nr:cytosol nonspecific dipeptidase [bacterium]